MTSICFLTKKLDKNGYFRCWWRIFFNSHAHYNLTTFQFNLIIKFSCKITRGCLQRFFGLCCTPGQDSSRFLWYLVLFLKFRVPGHLFFYPGQRSTQYRILRKLFQVWIDIFLHLWGQKRIQILHYTVIENRLLEFLIYFDFLKLLDLLIDFDYFFLKTFKIFI